MAAIQLMGLALLYFVPSVAAFSRGHRNATAIFLLNLLLGWTFLGWVVALIWAVTKSRDEKPGARQS